MKNKICFISDLHFGHNNIIRFDNRPFQSVEEMDETLISNWNNKINKNDTVYILGDISWYSKDKTAEILSTLKGNKYLLTGNHDNKLIKHDIIKKQFVEISPYMEIRIPYNNIQNQQVILSHYFIPLYNGIYRGAIHLYGHSHTTEDSILEDNIKAYIDKNGRNIKAYNVGCMYQYMNFTPKTLEEIVNKTSEYTINKGEIK